MSNYAYREIHIEMSASQHISCGKPVENGEFPRSLAVQE